MDIINTLNFSFVDFITSTEGIMMIVGIVLLIVGIILLLTDKKKKKAEPSETPAATAEPAVAPATDTVEPTAPAETPAPEVVPVVEAAAPTVETTAATPAPVETPVVETPVVETPVVEAQPTSAPVEETGPNPNEPLQIGATEPVEGPINFSEEVGEPAPALEIPTPEPAPAEPVVEVAPVVETPVVETPVVETPVVETPVVEPAAPEAPTAYGGASLDVSISEPEPERVAYGGANPLENTQPVPVQEVREAYGGAQVTPVTPAPVEAVEPVVEQPAVVIESAPEEAAPAPAPEAAPVQPSVIVPNDEEVEKLEF